MYDETEDPTVLRRRIEELTTEHRELDQLIAQLDGLTAMDHIQLRRLKKRKLLLKDMIAKLRSRLIPDLDA